MARRQLRAGLLQLLCAAGGLTFGILLPRLRAGPTVDGSHLPELLFTMGLGVIGVVTIVFSLLFGVVEWSASTFTPRLGLFRDSPLVWGTFAVTIGVFVFSVSAGVVTSNQDQVSLLVPIAAVTSVLTVFALIRALQTRAFLALQLAHVLAAITTRGRAVIEDLYQPATPGNDPTPPLGPIPGPGRTVTWLGPPGVIQQLDLRQLVDAAADADALVVFRVGVGETLHEGAPLAEVHGGDLADQIVRDAVVRGTERSFDQDPLLAFRLLADIAMRAMSSAVNDPATAVDAVNAIEGLLLALAVRDLDLPDISDHTGASRVRLVLPTGDDYLHTGVEDLLPYAANAPMVLKQIHGLLTNMLALSPAPRHATLTQLITQVQDQLTAPSRNGGDL
ncbi:DUF2254 family protein [Nocardioides endophyticus]|uniref:DUF2254 family protein n=1 Tax=Nocardioides endophyticus TaxID=1353775 RepID=UPI0031E5AA69